MLEGMFSREANPESLSKAKRKRKGGSKMKTLFVVALIAVGGSLGCLIVMICVKPTPVITSTIGMVLVILAVALVASFFIATRNIKIK